MVKLNTEEKKIALQQLISAKKIVQLQYEIYAEGLDKNIKKIKKELAEIAALEKQVKLPFYKDKNIK